MHGAKFTNADGVNPFGQINALLAGNKRAERKRLYESISKAKSIAQEAMKPKIEFAKDGSCTAYMVYVV